VQKNEGRRFLPARAGQIRSNEIPRISELFERIEPFLQPLGRVLWTGSGGNCFCMPLERDRECLNDGVVAEGFDEVGKHTGLQTHARRCSLLRQQSPSQYSSEP